MSAEADDDLIFAGVMIDRGQFVDNAGRPESPWLYFVDYIFADGARITMGSVATHAEAMFDARELAECANVPITDLTGGGRLH
jgi:hypothetical protein